MVVVVGGDVRIPPMASLSAVHHVTTAAATDLCYDEALCADDSESVNVCSYSIAPSGMSLSHSHTQQQRYRTVSDQVQQLATANILSWTLTACLRVIVCPLAASWPTFSTLSYRK